ncbi:uncharacterized protein HD556DRAFT_1432986 [Suillus plorans]|uniref:Uncharacterized protein n=1 Tax=Suillus plorans TaxID=116603 RepID=A0A9P7DG36_9AGAM|nr:uncharacterized protein HD556DRAFT_1432986 [Suillus plorans]KAG1791398.1 hypothetical protein HD556DRAFT_1432986 [Suillus plorans]
MVDWKTSKEIKAEGIAFTKVVYVLFGIYIWEICTTGGFELSVFLGRRKLAWPLVLFFFLCRYSMLFSFIGFMTLWEWERRAVLSMLALSFGKCAILIGTIMTVQASWDYQAGACIVVRTNHILLNLNYTYTMSFDFLILVMTLFVLRKRFRHEDLSGLLRRDGLVYFLITSTCNTIPAVLAALNLNSEPAMLQCFGNQT